MIQVRPFDALPSANLGWLKAHHHFPVDGRPDLDHEPVGALYVWNDDEFAPGKGFPMHAHRDVEIISYIRSGTVTHQDTLGNSYTIQSGDLQVMSAGTGIRHSEYNTGTEPLCLFQIWIAPNRFGWAPSYATMNFSKADRSGRLATLASGFSEDLSLNVLPLHADARLLGSRLRANESLTHSPTRGRKAYLVPAEGSLMINGTHVGKGSGVAMWGDDPLTITALSDAEIIMVETI